MKKYSRTSRILSLVIAAIMTILPFGALSALAAENELTHTVTYVIGDTMADLPSEYTDKFPHIVTVNDGDDHTVLSIKDIAGPLPANWEFSHWLDEDGETREPGDIVLAVSNDVTLTAVGKHTEPTEEFTINITYFDEWNNQTVGTAVYTTSTVGTITINSATVGAIAPANFTYPATCPTVTTVSGTTSYNVTVNGTLDKTIDSEVYRIVTTRTGLESIGVSTARVNGEAAMAAEYTLGNNISLSGSLWTPLGTVYNTGSQFTGTAFTGVLDGANKKITGLYTTNASYSFVGLIAYNEGLIKDLELYVGTVGSTTASTSRVVGNYYVGSIAGFNNGNGTINNCITYFACEAGSAGVIVATSIAGGITGCNYGMITNCHVRSAMTADGVNGTEGNYIYATGSTGLNIQIGNDTQASYSGSFVGGIAAVNSYAGTIQRCSNEGVCIRTNFSNTSYTGQLGGICGVNGNVVSECWSTFLYINRHSASSYTSAGSQSIGGLVGTNASYSSINNCWSYFVSLNGYGNIGGLVGLNQTNATITDTWACIGNYSMNGSYPSTYGDTIGSGAQKGSVSHMYIEDQAMSYSVGVAKDMVNVTLSELGFSSSIWEKPADSFPELIHNHYFTYIPD